MGVNVVHVALVVGAYLLGTLPSAHYVAGRRGFDPTREGSGNPGATNVFRVAGTRAGMIVFAADMGKGAVATTAGLIVGGRSLATVCWAAAVVGHVLPVTRRFRGMGAVRDPGCYRNGDLLGGGKAYPQGVGSFSRDGCVNGITDHPERCSTPGSTGGDCSHRSPIRATPVQCPAPDRRR